MTTTPEDVGRITVVLADDLSSLSGCAAEFYAATKFVKRFNFTRFCEVWKSFIESGHGVIFSIRGEFGANGMIGGIAHPEMYSGDLIASEFFWYVCDGHRGGGMSLYRAFEKWARAKGCVEMRMAALSDSMPGKMELVYRRLGFELAERQYVKELR